MAEELQHLIERIRKEGVENAQREADQILTKAREKAAAVVSEAESKARQILEKAQKDAQVYMEGSQRTLEQAARDLIITVGAGVESVLNEMAGKAVGEALDIHFLRDVLGRIIEAYFQKGARETRIEVLASPEDQKKLVEFFKSRYQMGLGETLTVLADHEIVRGFRVRSQGNRVTHEFTQEAIADALGEFLRPHLSEIVHRAVRSEGS